MKWVYFLRINYRRCILRWISDNGFFFFGRTALFLSEPILCQDRLGTDSHQGQTLNKRRTGLCMAGMIERERRPTADFIALQSGAENASFLCAFPMFVPSLSW
jgi:hypothetical protein|eukprot:COSAG06_NODE_4328_length_4362_cov_5.354680_7_plen_103_part_00